MKQSPSLTSGLYVQRVPVELHWQFASKCRLEDLTYAEALLKLIRERVKDQNHAGLSTAGAVPKDSSCKKLWIQKMPKQLMQSFGAWCKLRGKTQSEVVIAMMKEWVLK